MISCTADNDQVVPDYIDLLLSEGFTETNRMEAQSDELVSVSLENGALGVQLLLSAQGDIIVNISEQP